MTERTVDVPAIHCGHCVRAIAMEVEEVDGVVSIEGDPATKKVTVRFEPPATWEAIAAAMTEAGYPPAP